MNNAVTVPADKLAELQREAARYRWLTKNAFIGECYTDSGTILEVMNCDRRVPDEVGECCNVGEAIDAAIAAEGAPGVLVRDHQSFCAQTPRDCGEGGG
jgi:hypothetical protein